MPILIHMPLAMMLLRRRHKFISFWNHGTRLTNQIYQICSNFLDDATLFSNEVIFHTSANIYSHDPGRCAYLLRRRRRENLLKDKKTSCPLQRFWVAGFPMDPPVERPVTACSSVAIFFFLQQPANHTFPLPKIFLGCKLKLRTCLQFSLCFSDWVLNWI